MNSQVSNLEGLSPSDRILFDHFGRGPLEEPSFTYLHHAFEHFADHHPSAIAVHQDDGTSITYAELERRANILSNRLISDGLLPRQRVCLVIQRSIHMVVAILAILKANCQYIPLDGGVVPDETLGHILCDAQAPLIVCLQKFEHKVRKQINDSASVLILDGGEQFLHGNEARPGSKIIIPSDGAYIIYTSGMYSNLGPESHF
jgi:non-ribosomal peptide synthetase component F